MDQSKLTDMQSTGCDCHNSQSRCRGERVKRDLTSHVMILWNKITSTHVMRVRFKDES